VFLEAQFGVGVDVPADSLDFRLKIENAFCEHHDEPSSVQNT
jgi:hypothetical protein